MTAVKRFANPPAPDRGEVFPEPSRLKRFRTRRLERAASILESDPSEAVADVAGGFRASVASTFFAVLGRLALGRRRLYGRLSETTVGRRITRATRVFAASFRAKS